MEKLSIDILEKYQNKDKNNIKIIDEKLNDIFSNFNKKIIVLDDDPTGVQTVHDISVYTNWNIENIEKGFNESNSMFFILTNSRSFSKSQTIEVHTEITENIIKVSKKLNKDFIIILRGDSTLRGHYPEETETIAKVLEKNNIKVDGEVIIPFFLEGGRYTINNIHYVQEGEYLVPAGDTEFALDKTFGYKESDLCKWVEEKTNGKFKKEDVKAISIEDENEMKIEHITDILKSCNNFDKVIVNSISYFHIKVFTLSLLNAILEGKRFVYRTAAAFTKVIGNVSDKDLLKKEELIDKNTKNGGIIIVGSHVNKTSLQLEKLKEIKEGIEYIEFNQHLVLEEGGLEREANRVINITNDYIENGKTVVIYTNRKRLDINTGNKEDELKIASQISNSLTSIFSNLKSKPSFIIAKGGITSSSIGVDGLKVKCAKVKGQIYPGIPVWMTDATSKFPNMPYIIFPGNVGKEDTLKVIVEELIKK
ncbi:four-carbon acid sugar kinase family protein [Brachyspira pilosicoli]|uniref:four-carbon acid sugar kinase family protein n=1 Tax=Brachyspira pilosicoli TaxID=52584 RepID=UPI003005D1E5